MKKLAGWAGAVTATAIVYHRLSDSITPRTDAALLGVIAIVSLGCVFVQIGWTWKWRSLSLGLLSIFFGMGLLYARVAFAGFGYDLGQERSTLSLIRSLFLVGAVLTGWGLAQWAWRNRRRIFPYWRRHRAGGDDPFAPPGESRRYGDHRDRDGRRV